MKIQPHTEAFKSHTQDLVPTNVRPLPPTTPTDLPGPGALQLQHLADAAPDLHVLVVADHHALQAGVQVRGQLAEGSTTEDHPRTPHAVVFVLTQLDPVPGREVSSFQG